MKALNTIAAKASAQCRSCSALARRANACLTRHASPRRGLPVVFAAIWLAVAGYLVLIASPRYVSQSAVTIMRPSNEDRPPLDAARLPLSPSIGAHEDARRLAQYILSADMLYALDDALQLRKVFASREHDVIFRLARNASPEAMLAYYRARVDVVFDDRTGLLNIATQGFTPDFAQRLNVAILQRSEAFLNEISRTIAHEQLDFAQGELREARHKQAMAETKLLAHQNAHGRRDPAVRAEAAFYTTLYEIALASYEKTRQDTTRNMQHLIVVGAPHVAQDASYPRIGYALGSLALVLVLLHGLTRRVPDRDGDHPNAA